MKNSWIGIDLDGTLAHYDGFQGEEIIGEPVPRMMNHLKKFLENKDTVKIFTARAGTIKGTAAVKKWLKKNGLPDIEVTNVKDYQMKRLYDDRAIRVEQNTGRLLGI